MLDVRANYHTHCDFCDGRASAAAMALAARRAGYDVLGFSSHAPLSYPTSWALPVERLDEYAAEVRRLRAAWAPGGEAARDHGPMEVLLGLEIDWWPGERTPGDGAFDRLGLDFAIGSVHSVEIEGTGPFTVDGSRAEFEEAIRMRSRGNASRIWQEYYARLGALIDAGGFDILGHFDLVKKNNADGAFFDEGGTDYLDAAFEAAGRLKGRSIVVEINLGGMARGKTREPYPSLPILRELRRLDVPITFCADAHDVPHLGAHLDAARELARQAGYRSVAVLSGGRWTEVGIEAT